VSLRFGGSPDSIDLAIPAVNDTSLRLQLISAQTENLRLRQRNTALEQQNTHLRNRLRRYENSNTPPSQEGGAGAPPDDESPTTDDDGDDEESETDDGDSEDEHGDQTDEESAGGDSDAASDSSPGRSPGHEGTTRPPPDPDETVWVENGYCSDCDRILTDPDSYISQTVVETPHPVPLTVIKYKRGQHHCSCGNEILAEHPDCPQTGRFGPNVLAQTALRRFRQRVPNRRQAEIFDWQLDYPVSHRTVYNLTKRVADRLRPAYEDVKAKIRESDVVYCDETGLSVDGDQHWIWTFVTDEEVFYTIDESRGSQVLEEVLGEEFAEDSILSCDGWPAYRTYHTKLQRCWAHLLREAEFVAERYREAETLSDELHELHEDLTAFDEKDPPASARERRRADASLHLEGLLREEYQAEEVQKLVKKIRNGLGCWLTFVTEPDVDSTNNRAERALREQVMLRKMFRSLRSAEGVRIHETITTMLATWKRRGLDPPEQLRSVLGGRDLEARLEAS
jgi:transposase